MLTEVQLFNIYNTLCLSAMTLAAAMVCRRNPSAFFRFWLFATGGSLGLSATELVASWSGRSVPLDLAALALATGVAWALYRAAGAFPRPAEDRAPGGGVVAGVLAVVFVASAIVRLAGVPWATACLGGLTAYVWGYAYLGVRLLRAERPPGSPSPAMMAWPSIAFAMVLLTYPALLGGPYFWIGFVATGALQFALGLGVVVFVLEDGGRRLAEQNERLTRLDGLKDQLLANVSHELRTPITAIKTATFILAEDADRFTPDQVEMLTIIDRSNDQLARRVADMIDYSLLGSGLMHYDRRAADLRPAVEDAAAPLRPAFATKGVRLEIALPPAPVVAHADHHRVGQVLQNLLGNALKFTPRDGEVRVTLREAPGEALLEVRDTGTGIPEEFRQRIFERHFQAATHGARRTDGIGLGLAIVRAIVEDGHGGRVAVDVNEPRGAVFEVALPLAPRDQPPSASAQVR